MKKPQILILAVNENNTLDFKYLVAELANLCDAANFEVREIVTQNLQKIDNTKYVGTGKVAEVKDMLEYLEDIDLVVTMHELSGSQNRNLEKHLDTKIMDRTQLILEIFNLRANTKEAKIQVTIAQLQYNLPRMIGSYDNLSRQGGGKVGTVNRGGGEKKIEVDKRVIKEQIIYLKNELERIVRSRDIQRLNRENSQMKIVAVVGYTNAGKSTLMNALVSDERQVFEKDMLFATLDTSVRQIKLQNNHQFLLVDTVGFVSNLPHDLVNAFSSTLEEVLRADLIIHLQDLTNPSVKMHKQAVSETLTKLKADHIPQLEVFNKVDLVEDISAISVDNNSILISAKNDINVDQLLNIIDINLFGQVKLYKFRLNYDKMSLLSTFHEISEVQNEQYDESGVAFEVLLSDEQFDKYKEYLVK